MILLQVIKNKANNFDVRLVVYDNGTQRGSRPGMSNSNYLSGRKSNKKRQRGYIL